MRVLPSQAGRDTVGRMHISLLPVLRIIRLSVVLTGLIQLAILAATPGQATRLGTPGASLMSGQVVSAPIHPAQVAILTAKLTVAGPGNAPSPEPLAPALTGAALPPAPSGDVRLVRTGPARDLTAQGSPDRAHARGPPLVV